MADDICTRLRSGYAAQLTVTHEAADEIERLRESEKASAASVWASNDIANDTNRLYTMAKQRADAAEEKAKTLLAIIEDVIDDPMTRSEVRRMMQRRAGLPLGHSSSKPSEGG